MPVPLADLPGLADGASRISYSVSSFSMYQEGPVDTIGDIDEDDNLVGHRRNGADRRACDKYVAGAVEPDDQRAGHHTPRSARSTPRMSRPSLAAATISPPVPQPTSRIRQPWGIKAASASPRRSAPAMWPR